MPPADPLRLCPHSRFLLYARPDGSTWCVCPLRADPRDRHLDERFAAVRAQWDALGRQQEARRG